MYYGAMRLVTSENNCWSRIGIRLKYTAFGLIKYGLDLATRWLPTDWKTGAQLTAGSRTILFATSSKTMSRINQLLVHIRDKKNFPSEIKLAHLYCNLEFQHFQAKNNPTITTCRHDFS
jgi:hypothetical protein